MPIMKYAVTKTLQFQGRTEEFSNVYTIDQDTMNEADLEAVSDALVAAERFVHTSAVQFKKVQVWNISGIPNVMRFVKDYATAGTAAGGAAQYRECAMLVTWELPRKVGLTRSFARRLAKWIHSGGSVDGYDVSGASANAQPSAGSARRTYTDALATLPAGANLCNEEGLSPSDPPMWSPYLEHRQFPRGRKQTA